MSWAGQSLLTLRGMSAETIIEILDTASSFVSDDSGGAKRVSSLQGRVVASLFFEESTRTRLSFETAAKRLGADVVSLAIASSSVQKGESLRDTVATIAAMGLDAIVLRHKSSGAAEHVARFVPDVRVINAGDGLHQHPTQGLLDVFTVREILAERQGARGVETGGALFRNLHVLIVGDIRHSRVARSDIAAYSALGAEVRIAAPRPLLPSDYADWPVTVVDDLDEALAWADVVGLLRLQQERGSGSFVPSLSEFRTTYGITEARSRLLRPGALILHPGPINRGVEIDSVVADGQQACINRQVANGVPVRMAVLHLAVSGSKER